MNKIISPYEISCWVEWRNRISADPLETSRKAKGYLRNYQAFQQSVQADGAYWSCKCGYFFNSKEYQNCERCGSPRR
jgi:hypothetical protein